MTETDHARNEAIRALEADAAAHEAQRAAAAEFGKNVAAAHHYGEGDVRAHLRQHGVTDGRVAADDFEHDDLSTKGLNGLRARRQKTYAEYSTALRNAVVAAANQRLITPEEQATAFESLSLPALRTVTRVELSGLSFTLDGEVTQADVQARLAKGLGALVGEDTVADVRVTTRTETV